MGLSVLKLVKSQETQNELVSILLSCPCNQEMMERSQRRMGGAYGDHFLLSWNKAGTWIGTRVPRSQKVMDSSHLHPLFVSHDGVAGEIPSVSTPEMMGHLDMIFISLSQNQIFLPQEFAAASCFEIHPFEVAKWIWVSELLFHHLKVLPSFRHLLPQLDHNLHEDGDLVLSPALRTVAGPQQVLHTFVEWMHVWMRGRRSCTRKTHNIALLTCTAPCSILLKLSPVPSQVPVMTWRCGLRLIYMPGLIVPVSLPPQWGLCKHAR